jgi:hypothetical protein
LFFSVSFGFSRLEGLDKKVLDFNQDFDWDSIFLKTSIPRALKDNRRH